MKRIKLSLFLAMLFVAAGFYNAHAKSAYQTSFRSTYPAAVGSAIDNCSICHPGGNTGSLNPYANAYAGAGHAYAPIETRDSDGDGFTNLAEITAKTYPGDAASRPGTPPANRPPVANAGGNQTVTAGARVTLNGSASSDPDGTITGYRWTQTGSPGVTLSSATAVSPTFTAPTVTSSTTLTFSLTVTDNGGLTSPPATCTVTVNPVTPANQAPTANAGANQTVTAGSAVTLNGSASRDPDGTITGYRWTQTGSPGVTLSSATAVSPTFTAPTVTSSTTLTFSLTVTDNGGLTSPPATCSVTVNPGTPGNQAPTANAGANQTVTAGATVTLNGSASRDPDGTITGYRWAQTGSPGVTLSSATAVSPTFTAPTVTSSTTLTFSLTVTDNGGLTSTASCTVAVNPTNPSTNLPPVANAGLDLAVLPGTLVTLEGFYSSDPDDGIASYAWAQTGGTTVALSDARAMDPIFQAPSTTGTLGFKLVVTDKGGRQSSDTVNVVVLSPDATPPPAPVNKPPVANAGPDQSVGSGSTVRLSGSASSDPDDGIASYQWRQTSGVSVSLSGATTANASFVSPRVSSRTTLVFQLTAKDKAGQSASDSVTITVGESDD